MKLSSMANAAFFGAFCAATFAGSGYAADYTISSQTTTFTVPSGWPNVQLAKAAGPSTVGSAPSDVNFGTGTPILICTGGGHFKWDSASCGDRGNPSKPYAIGSGNPEFAITVAIPAQGGKFSSVQLMSGDALCQRFSNHNQPTNWWTYKIPNPNANAAAYRFAANVGFQTDKSGQYYALLTNCRLSNAGGSAK